MTTVITSSYAFAAW